MKCYYYFKSKNLNHPKSIFGLFFAFHMDQKNKKINELILENIPNCSNEEVLEIGFGSGKTLKKIVKEKNPLKMYGIDVSSLMVFMSTLRNIKSVINERVFLRKGSIENTMFDSNKFSIIFSVHSIYFWNDLTKTIVEIHRLLKDDGTLLLAFREKKSLQQKKHAETNFKIYETNYIINVLKENGFFVKKIIKNKFDNFEICIVLNK